MEKQQISSRPKKRKNYTQLDLNLCVEAINSKRLTLAQAAKYYNIPKSTIFDRIKNLVPLEAKYGPNPVLSTCQEELIIKWTFFCINHGFRVTRDLILDSIKKFIVSHNIANPFTNNRPGRHWYESFCQRHPELAENIARNLSTSREAANPEKRRDWYNRTGKFLIAQNLKDIDPSRIVNMDECTFLPCERNGYALTRNNNVIDNKKTIHKVVNRIDEQSISVLFTITAAGEMAPPMVSYSYKRIPSPIAIKMPDDWVIGKTENGWMTYDTFYGYVKNVLYPWAIKKGTKFPLIIYLNGHTRHVTYSLHKFCKEKNIVLISLLHNATDLMQPLDVTFFDPLKVAFEETLNEFRAENDFGSFKKEDFAPVLKNALEKLSIPEIVELGFSSSGLYPFEPESFISNSDENMSTYCQSPMQEPNYELHKHHNENMSTSCQSPMQEPNYELHKHHHENMNTSCQSPMQEPNYELHKHHLAYFEERILDSCMLAEFRSGLVSDVRNHELFKAWQKMKQLSGETVLQIKTEEPEDYSHESGVPTLQNSSNENLYVLRPQVPIDAAEGVGNRNVLGAQHNSSSDFAFVLKLEELPDILGEQ